MRAHEDRTTFGGLLLQHVIVFLICVVFPGGVTMMAPASWLTFQRNGNDDNAVSCTTRTCVFFVVPFRTEHIDEVTEIGHRERAGGIERQREFGRTTQKDVHVDGEGFLQIHGVGNQLVEVSVSPASLESVVGKSQNFLSSPLKNSTTIFAIANWKFGALMGGVLTSFTVLYVVGYSLGLLKWIFTGLKRALLGGAVGGAVTGT